MPFGIAITQLTQVLVGDDFWAKSWVMSVCSLDSRGDVSSNAYYYEDEQPKLSEREQLTIATVVSKNILPNCSPSINNFNSSHRFSL